MNQRTRTDQGIEIVEPIPDTAAEHYWSIADVWPGSVAVLSTMPGIRGYVVYYEGGIYERERDDTPTEDQRAAWAKRAAGRAIQHYPSGARFFIAPEDIEGFRVVGFVSSDYRVEWIAREPELTTALTLPDPRGVEKETLRRFADGMQCIMYRDEELQVDPDKEWSPDTLDDIAVLMEMCGLGPVAEVAPEQPVEPTTIDRHCCHNPRCRRYGVMTRDLPDGADLYHSSDHLDALVCPDCGGTDVY